jgi:hypothetical protein
MASKLIPRLKNRLGGQSVSELVWRHVSDSGGGGGPADRCVNAGLWDRPPVLGEHQLAGLVAALVEPLSEQGFHAWVQWDVPVGV